MNLLTNVSMPTIYAHYLERVDVHHQVLDFLKNRKTHDFVHLALGVSNPRGNYSASEHGLGKRILASSTALNAVFALAEDLYVCKNPRDIPQIIRARAIDFLKISVGSEMAMLLRPNDFWVANVRTVWAYLLVKHDYNLNVANEAM